jgi:hypothetical protein
LTHPQPAALFDNNTQDKKGCSRSPLPRSLAAGAAMLQGNRMNARTVVLRQKLPQDRREGASPWNIGRGFGSTELLN